MTEKEELIGHIRLLLPFIAMMEWDSETNRCLVCDHYQNHGHADDCELHHALVEAQNCLPIDSETAP